MIDNNSFHFIYEDDDDCINAPRSKRECNQVPNTTFPLARYQETHEIYNSNDVRPESVGSKRRLVSDSSFCSTNPKRMKVETSTKVHSIPDIIIRQSGLAKANLNDVFNELNVIKFIPPNSQEQVVIHRPSSDLLNDNQIPLLAFLFDCSTIPYLRLFERFKDKNIKVIGITPSFEYFNEQSYPIIIDEHGEISKKLNIRGPLGGGIYPIPSIFLFDSFKDEVFRIKLGYDFNVYYDSTIKSSLQNVLLEGIEYTLGI